MDYFNTKYVLRDGALVFLEETVLQIFFGTWNYRSLSVDYKPIRYEVMQLITNSLSKDGISIEEMNKKYKLTKQEIEDLKELFKQLSVNGFIYSNDFIQQAIGGSFLLLGFNEIQTLSSRTNEARNRPKVAILTNISKLEENSLLTQYSKWLNMDIIDLNSMSELFEYDATERTEAIEHLQFLDNFRRFSAYDSVLVILAYANPRLLRNINRIFLHYKIPWLLATLDGPFIIFTSFIPEHTGCFECFELRITSQMRSIQEYKSFVSLSAQKPSFKDIEFIPILQLPISIAMNELILLSSFKANHFIGRVLSIYVPFFEIQIFDLLRLPVCPACGNTAKPTLNELYFDFRRFVNDITNKLSE
jgi:thiazole/oxazole-forming peptide maturase SagC family component